MLTVTPNETHRDFWHRRCHPRHEMLYPWEISEVQDINDAVADLSGSLNMGESEEDDDEPGWGALMQSTLRDINSHRAA